MTSIQEGLYTERQISDKYRILWRILKEENEIEVVMVAKGTGYVGLGWRPADADKNCQRWPHLGDGVYSGEEAEGEAESEAEAESEPSAAAQIQEPREKRMSTRTDVGISFVMSSISSSNRNKREAQYTRRFPRAFAVPLNGEESTAKPGNVETP